jgi:outer membrane protein
MLRRLTQLALLLLALDATLCLAEEETEEVTESRWRLGAAVGYGVRSNPLVQSDDIPIYVDLDIAWFGDHWFFDNGDLGLTVTDNDAMTASLVARVNSDRVFFGNTERRFVTFDLGGMPLDQAVEFKVPDRDYAIELGVEILTDGPWGAVQLSAFHDVSATHEGFELHADYSYGWRDQRLYIEPSIGASYKSADLNNYYWGVTEDEAGVVVAPYEAGAGLNWHVRLMVGYQLSRHWGLSLVTEYERINDEAAASPIVAERNVLGYFAGVAYRF